MSSLPPDMKLPFSRPLFRGMQGPDVKQLQVNLNTLNIYYLFHKNPNGVEIELPITGFFGDETIRMLKAFQKFCDLPPSGMYEFRTHDLLEWKNYNRLDNTNKAWNRIQQQQVQEARAKEAARIMGNSRHW